jgi:hypothetical protein
MKTTYKGQTTLIDPTTGESFNFDVISKNGDTLDKRGWRRVIMSDLMSAVEQIGNQKIRVLEYLIDKMDTNNQINKTIIQMSKESNISYKTVCDTLKALKECNLIKKYGGVYVLNCGVISTYGKSEKNGYLLIEYGFNGKSIVKIKEKNKNDKDIEIENLKNKIKELEELIPISA